MIMSISSEALKAGLHEPEKAIEEMTEEEIKAFRCSFDGDAMGFDGVEGTEGVDEDEEA